MKLFIASLVVLVASPISTDACAPDGPCCYTFTGADGYKMTSDASWAEKFRKDAADYTESSVASPCPTCDDTPCIATAFPPLELDGCSEKFDKDGILKFLTCDYDLPKILVPHCKTKQKVDGNEVVLEYENFDKEVYARQRKLRGANPSSRVLSIPFEEEVESFGACPGVCPDDITIEGVTYALDLGDCAEGCECTFCSVVSGCNEDSTEDPEPCTEQCLVKLNSDGQVEEFELECDADKISQCDGDFECEVMDPEFCTCEDSCSGDGLICTPKSDSDPIDSWKCHVENEKPEKPEPVVCVNVDGTYYQGPKAEFPDVLQRSVRNGPCTTQIVCKGEPIEAPDCVEDQLKPLIEKCTCDDGTVNAPEP